MFNKSQGSSSALVDGFEAAGVVPEEGTVRRQRRRVKRMPASSNEDWSTFEKMKFFR